MKNKKKKIDWKRTIKNNIYMLKFIHRASPGYITVQFLHSIVGGLSSFLLDTYIFQYVLNALQTGEALKRILFTVSWMLGATLIYYILQIPLGMYYELQQPKIEEYIKNLIYKKASEAELACFERAEFFDVYVKAAGESSERAFAVLNSIEGCVWNIVNGAANIALIFTIDPLFLLLAAVPLLCTVLVGKKKNRYRHEYKMKCREVERRRDYVRRTFYLNDFSKEMRLTSMWKVMFERMRSTVDELREIHRKYGYGLMFFEYLYDLLFDIIVNSGSKLLALYRTLVSKTMLIGDCYVAINSAESIAYSLNSIGNSILSLDENSLYIDNIREFMDYKVKIPEDASAPDAPEFESLELKNVTFAYDGQEHSALENVNITVHRGEKIAVVGHNGAGKSTLVKLLQRLYDPSEGEILLNGENIKGFRLSTYRNKFSAVFQDYVLFSASVAENVMLKGEISDAERKKVKSALKNSGIWEKIESLPNGMDTTVTKEFDSDGAVFSGGEAQKISIARVFAGENEIVIMDEPTSALDPIAEQEMYTNMFKACADKTVVFISHRLSSAVMADRVYMFENGRIIEQGTHAELLVAGGKYSDMWHKQADTYSEDIGAEVTV